MTQTDLDRIDRPVFSPIVVPQLVKAAKDLPGMVTIAAVFVLIIWS